MLTFQRVAQNRFGLVAENLHQLVHCRPQHIQHIHIVVQFRAVRSLAIPPPSDAAWWGGVAVHPENLPGPQTSASAMCCDSVAMRAVSTRCQLKSLQDERWRRPLSHRKARGRTPPASECNAMDASGPAALACCACSQHEACGAHSNSHVV
jgi:hypothetical protein